MGHAVKIFFWIVISLVLSLAIGAAIVLPIWNVIESTTEVASCMVAIKDGLSAVWNGGLSIRAAASDVLTNLRDGFVCIFSQNVGATLGLIFAAVFVYAFYCFVFGLSYYTNADVIILYEAS